MSQRPRKAPKRLSRGEPEQEPAGQKRATLDEGPEGFEKGKKSLGTKVGRSKGTCGRIRARRRQKKDLPRLKDFGTEKLSGEKTRRLKGEKGRSQTMGRSLREKNSRQANVIHHHRRNVSKERPEKGGDDKRKRRGSVRQGAWQT